MKIVLAGGAGNVGREIYETLVAKNKHEVVVFSRKNLLKLRAQGMNVVQVDYTDKSSLTKNLQGVDVVLSFIVTMYDLENIAQKNLIDASVEAGVKRFAPSEWATRSHCGIPAYKGKDEVFDYLKEINKDETVLEYTLFQPGLFLNYFSYPYKSCDHMMIFPMPIDIGTCCAIIHKNTKARIALTSVQDLAEVVARAIELDEKWPEVSGMRGTQISVLNFIDICGRVRGGDILRILDKKLTIPGRKFEIEEVDENDLLAGRLTSSWVPIIDHPTIKVKERSEFSQAYFSSFILAFEKGAWDSSDEWNQRLPDFKFQGAETFLRGVWEGKE